MPGLDDVGFLYCFSRKLVLFLRPFTLLAPLTAPRAQKTHLEVPPTHLNFAPRREKPPPRRLAAGVEILGLRARKWGAGGFFGVAGRRLVGAVREPPAAINQSIL